MSYLDKLDEFTKIMRERLKEKESKYGKPDEYPIEAMRNGLKEEFLEWLDGDNEDEELIDIANYCFLIWYLKRHSLGGKR